MKLDKIKLSGFKSFADPTVIQIEGSLTAVVGPNGCGKSNVIDAIRWVMGESSAKHLRGGNMTDVVFNGSAQRKPVGIATVELIFDNSYGKMGGEYAQYHQISIKRQVSRDGQSSYALNGSRCRRKDITDLFLGTGLGARSYAIIEQGTISRMVESKPDELRVHIEEAAGISKYKERRQETETRMRHTRENLERLDDLREEVGKQLASLKKQAEKAEKFTQLKALERQYRAELLAIRWQQHQQSYQQLEIKLQQIGSEHNRLFTQLHQLDQAMDDKRWQQKNQQQTLDTAQKEYYHLVAEISRLQQAIKHNESSYQETVTEIERLQQQVDEAETTCQQDQQQLEEIQENLKNAEESKLIAEEKREQCLQKQVTLQQSQQQWQQQWQKYLAEEAHYKEQWEIQQFKYDHLSEQSHQQQQRLDSLQAEYQELSDTDLLTDIESLAQSIELIEHQREDLQQQLEVVVAQMIKQRQRIKQYHHQLHQHRAELQTVKGQISSLELLQQHAMGKDQQPRVKWLTERGLENNLRLAELLTVDSGWEIAVETVLNYYLEATCVDSLTPLLPQLEQLTEHSVCLFETHSIQTNKTLTDLPQLLDKIQSQWDLTPLLSTVFYAESLESACAARIQLQPEQSIITPDGHWVGHHWLKLAAKQENKTGILQRERQLRELKHKQTKLQTDIERLEKLLENDEFDLEQSEQDREALQQQDKHLGSEFSSKNAQFSAYSAKQTQQQQRLNQITQELETITDHLIDIAESRYELEQLNAATEEKQTQLADNRILLDSQQAEIDGQQHLISQELSSAQQALQIILGQIESFKTSSTLTVRQIDRLQQQRQQSIERITELKLKLNSTLMPLDDEKQRLEQQEANKHSLEKKLHAARQRQQDNEQQLTELAEQHLQTQRAMDKQKEQLDKIRFEQQDSHVRQQTIQEQLNEMAANPEQLLQTLATDANEQRWKQKLDDFTQQINRLGSINLTAIDDYQSQSERMNFLNEQHNDLVEALTTLDLAIAKIDKESKLRFKQTFDKINAGLDSKFPKLFGGGQAYLELTDSDLLQAGVNIIARPPGKKNSSIHLLSGGEKALTAVALVFSIFDLNPAPFCLLDEVDAPLDDANVVRFSKMVKDMSATVQFLYISHNKVTMEIAKQLIGVTMKEPGVSKMVSVDIEEAVQMAEN